MKKLQATARKQSRAQVLGDQDGSLPSPPGSSKEKYGKFDDEDEINIDDQAEHNP
jgi:hypothetical protein